jgi:hypothetical protein
MHRSTISLFADIDCSGQPMRATHSDLSASSTRNNGRARVRANSGLALGRS